MSYKYRYRFVIEGLNRQTKQIEGIHIVEQDRNTGMDHKIYKLIRTLCYSAYDKYSSVMVTITRWDLRYPADSLEYIQSRYHVGMFFFDLYETFTRRSFCLTRPNGERLCWYSMRWKD